MGTSRTRFGPSREEIWRQLSTAIGARYVEGGTWTGDRVQATHGQWTVTLDSYVVVTGQIVIPYTRMRAPYVNPAGFRFTVYRTGAFSDIAKWLGMQDVQVGHEPFDEDFIVKGTDEAKVRDLFSNARIRELIAVQREVHLTVKDDEGWFGPSFPDGVDELTFHAVGVIKDLERLKQLYELFAETLEQLCRIGAAYEQDPKVAV